MARYLLILLTFLSLDCFAGRNLIIINQHDPAFIKDAQLWESYFKHRHPGISVYHCTKYDVRVIDKEVAEYLAGHDHNDTLYLIFTAHMIPNEGGREGLKGCLVLDDPGGFPDINTEVIWQEKIEDWLINFDAKDIRTLAILITCKPYMIINPMFARQLKQVTTIFATDKDYCLMTDDSGSLLYQAFASKHLHNVSGYFTLAQRSWMDKQYYQFTDKTTHIEGMSFYPIKPVIYGPDFSF